MRLIDYNAAIDRYHEEYKTQDICDGAEDRDFLLRCFDEAETIDAAPVVHGRWIGEEISIETGNISAALKECSVCHRMRPVDAYCSHCGAKMDLPEKDGD